MQRDDPSGHRPGPPAPGGAGADTVLAALAHRLRARSERQQLLTERLRSGELRPGALADLAELAAAARRGVRDGDHILVMAGTEIPDRGSGGGPVPLGQALSAAVSASEAASRTVVPPTPSVSLTPYAGPVFAQILSELLAHATAATAPGERLELHSRWGPDGGLVLELLSPRPVPTRTPLDELDRMLAAGQPDGPVAPQEIGLYLAARLTRAIGGRLGVRGSPGVASAPGPSPVAVLALPPSALAGARSSSAEEGAPATEAVAPAAVPPVPPVPTDMSAVERPTGVVPSAPVPPSVSAAAVSAAAGSSSAASEILPGSSGEPSVPPWPPAPIGDAGVPVGSDAPGGPVANGLTPGVSAAAGPGASGAGGSGPGVDAPGANGPTANGTGPHGLLAHGPVPNGPSPNAPTPNGPHASGPAPYGHGPGTPGPGAHDPGAQGPAPNGPAPNGPGVHGPGPNVAGPHGAGRNGPAANGAVPGGSWTHGVAQAPGPNGLPPHPFPAPDPAVLADPPDGVSDGGPIARLPVPPGPPPPPPLPERRPFPPGPPAGQGPRGPFGSPGEQPGPPAPPEPPPTEALPVSGPTPPVELFGPFDSEVPVPVDDLDGTPIFAAVASAWFRDPGTPPNGSPGRPAPAANGHRPGDQPANWTTAGDAEFEAARTRADRVVEAPVTANGLPVRRPGQQMVPPSRRDDPSADRRVPSSAERQPDRVRNRLASYQRGLREGRHRAAEESAEANLNGAGPHGRNGHAAG